MELRPPVTQRDADERGERRGPLVAIYWLIAAGYALYAFGRLAPQPFHAVHSVRETIAWAASLTEALQLHWALLLVALVVVHVARCRDWRPVAAVAPLVLVLIALPLAHGAIDGCAPGVTCPGPDEGTRITSANLLVGNEASARRVARELTSKQPDVLVLQEYSSTWDERLRPRLERAGLERIEAEMREDSFGLAVYVRDGVTASSRRLVLGSGEAPQFRVSIRHAGDAFALYAIHTLPPLSRSYSIAGRHEFGELLDRLADEDGPHVLVGDFNATRASAQHRTLTDRGYRDVWESHGHGRGASWRPPTLPDLFPGLALDHVYVHGNRVASGRPQLGAANGSDHRPITVDIAAPSDE